MIDQLQQHSQKVIALTLYPNLLAGRTYGLKI
jgi:hypothetical protein